MHRNRVIFSVLFVLSLCISPAILGISLLPVTAQVQQTTNLPTIRLVENSWLASKLNALVAKTLIESELGYPVEIYPVDESEQWGALANGSLHASLEIWPSGHADNIDLYINQTGLVEYGGALGVIGKIGWYVPAYVVAEHPELATWEGYADPALAALFATPETGERGRFIGGDASWVQYDEEIIANLGLHLQVVRAGSEEAILDIVQRAYEAQEPVLFYFWTPHTIHAQYDLVEVALPEHTDICYEGVDLGRTSGVFCDYPPDRLIKAFSPELETTAPDVYAFLRNFQLTTEDQINMMAAVELEGLSPEEAVLQWIEANDDYWQSWFIN